MNKKRVFKKLKNGKDTIFYHKVNAQTVYTVRLSYNNDLFTLHTYYLDGNDVFDESNYKDEKLVTYSDFNILIKTLEESFPGIEIRI